MCFRPAAIEAEKTCPACGAVSEPGLKTCAQCGAELPDAPAFFLPGNDNAPGRPKPPGAPGAPGMPKAPGAPSMPKPPGAPNKLSD